MNRASLSADFLLLLTAAIWGFGFVAQRMGMDHVGPFTYNGVRFGLGSLTLIPLLFRSRGKAPPPALRLPPGKRAVGVLALGAVLFAAASLQQVALLWTTAGKAGFITGLYVVIVPLLGLFWGQPLLPANALGALLAGVGLYLLSVTASLSLEPGDGLLLLSAFLWSAQVLLVAWLAPRSRPVELAGAQFSICSALSLAVAAVCEPVEAAALRAAAGPILYGGVLSVGVAYTLQVVAQQRAHPAHASILMSLEAVFAALGGGLLLGERLTPRALAGCALMLAGMILSQQGGRRERRRR
ncbi:MAG: DMT family transporter [Desulfobacterales bacterium]